MFNANDDWTVDISNNTFKDNNGGIVIYIGTCFVRTYDFGTMDDPSNPGTTIPTTYKVPKTYDERVFRFPDPTKSKIEFNSFVNNKYYGLAVVDY